MIKERTCVFIGIFLILALLCSCAMFYSVNGADISASEVIQSAVTSPISMMLSREHSPVSVGGELFTLSSANGAN